MSVAFTTSTKTVEQSFVDWEANVFGFGYGTGEQHVLRALKLFMDAIGRDDMPNAYDYEKLEAVCGAEVTWLLINILCRHGVDIIEYGSSPRYGWLTPEGERLLTFMATKTVGELEELVCGRTEDHPPCAPDCCNCGPNGYEKGRVCPNPFWQTPK
jgi:hypothetical protein